MPPVFVKSFLPNHLFLCLCLTVSAFCGRTHYEFNLEPIDVVIPCAPCDQGSLDLCIEGIRKYGKDIGRIIVISKSRLTDQAEWFDEANFPFDRWAIAKVLFDGDEEGAKEHMKGPNRTGWILQQLLKFYAPTVIPGISSNVLMLDADTIFLNPISFRNGEGAPYFATAGEYMEPYFSQMKNLIPWLKRKMPHSGIVHHMLFQKPVLDDLFRTIEWYHNRPVWEAMVASVTELMWACLSEYEIYFNFILTKSDQPVIRPLLWKNHHSLKDLDHYRNKGYAYVTCHKWMRRD